MTHNNDEGKADLKQGVWYRSQVSGLFYRNAESAGEIDAVIIEGRWFYPDEDEDEDDVANPCPKCGTQLTAKWSGVECPNEECDYWFCY